MEKQEPAAQAPDAAGEGKQEVFDAAYVKKLRDEAAKHRTEAAANKAAAEELAALKAAQQSADEVAKTEAQKTADRLAALESELATERAEKLRAQVAAAKGLTPAMARRLAGATREELEADAEELLADIGTKYAPKSATPEQTGAGATGEPPAAGPSLEMAQALTRR